MITNQIMKRPFMGSEIHQRTKDSFFHATQLLDIYNEGSNTKKVFAEFWSNKSTKDFIIELENDLISNIGNSLHLKTFETTRGNKGGTWMHPYLFVKFAMWLSPKFELQIIKWVYDNLIDFRTQAGDHYKEMCEVIASRYLQLKDKKPDPLVYKQEAKFLNYLCYNDYQGGKRNQLSESELDLLNKLQKLNIQLIKSGQYTNEQRKKLLSDFAYSFKLTLK
jgi:hypothetical protein